MARAKQQTTDAGKLITKTQSKDVIRLKSRLTNIRPAKLKLNMIDTGTVVSVNYKGEITKINKSWIELCLLVLSYIYDCYPGKFMKALERGKICSQNFDVTKTPPNYNSYNNEKYIIPGTPYFLMTNSSPSAILKAVQGFPDALEIEDEDFLLNIDPTMEIDDGLRYVNGVEFTSDIIPLTELDISRLDTYTFATAYIWDKKIKASSFDAIAVRLIREYAKKDKRNLDIAVKCSIEPVVGVSNGKEITSLESIVLSKGEIYTYYTNKSGQYTLTYILNFAEAIGIPKSCIKIKVDQIRIKNS